ncbi:MAG: transposase [Gemmatimonadetes bacterium]|nr:transposase [Gemmatimonadota bacterium]MCC6774941.1 transposase [Gemmatimonadaceae bacterium]
MRRSCGGGTRVPDAPPLQSPRQAERQRASHIDRANSHLRDACLNEEWFTSLVDARVRIERFRIAYRTEHSQCLGNLTPAEYAPRVSAVSADRRCSPTAMSR